MLNVAFLLTLATLSGLLLGFVREWLLIDTWGAGQTTDAIVLALFLPEAIRMTLAGGILQAAALPLYHQQEPVRQHAWLNALGNGLLVFSLVLAALLCVLAESWIKLLGPGLTDAAQAMATTAFRWLVWCIPALFFHAYCSIIAHLQQRFLLAGLGSLLFNLPVVIWLLAFREQAGINGFAISCLIGSLLMAAVMLPGAVAGGWRPGLHAGSLRVLRTFGRRLGPLLLSNAGSQGLILLERMLASMLGEGMVTWVNLARKLVNLPLVGLMALNQVLLSLLSAKQQAQRPALLRHGLVLTSTLALPAATGLIAISPTLVMLLFPGVSVQVPGFLLAGFAASLLFGAWNALLARYAYANNNTRLPLYCELGGSGLHALALLILVPTLGAGGFALANLLGVLTTCLLLLYRQNLLQQLPWRTQSILGTLMLAIAFIWIHPLAPGGLQAALAVASGLVCLLLVLFIYTPWRTSSHTE